MNSETVNDALPAKRKRSGGGRAFHSRLEPFVDFIREQRRRRKTWKEIAALLLAAKATGCVITAQGVHQFPRRATQRQNLPHRKHATAKVWSVTSSGSAIDPPRKSISVPT